jgi:copper(I)-binding protein
MMTMKPVSTLEIPAGAKVVFTPGSYHVMLYDINKTALKKGTAPLIFTFEKAGKITVEAKIKSIGRK